MLPAKKITRIIVIIFLTIAAYGSWLFFGSSTTFEEPRKNFYLRTGSNLHSIANDLKTGGFIRDKGIFTLLAKAMNFDKYRAGKYEFEKGVNMFTIIRTLKAFRETQVQLVITKLRTKEDLARKLGKNFECDSARFMQIFNNNDSLQRYGLDTNTVMAAIIPNTYNFYWATSCRKIFSRLKQEQDKFWTAERQAKAKKLNLTSLQVYTLASIVEEETNKAEDKGKIASVYLNRLQKGMRLGADPTIKFALKDFGLKRIYHKHLTVPSPYNTYQITGLPPGPICTPSAGTIDAVLDAPATPYLFFAARPDFKGYSSFAVTYAEHLKNARAYQLALDSLMKAKAGK
ncbi:MAG TPA: endolytic transglycosylase MltG [Ferruginibacter sp.]|nr:endolytic transglycosylase MltG [Ferruginibacter sp.]HMP21613.1 endolytic transglycosylase MltG [Ferruginibacter sp.]